MSNPELTFIRHHDDVLLFREALAYTVADTGFAVRLVARSTHVTDRQAAFMVSTGSTHPPAAGNHGVIDRQRSTGRHTSTPHPRINPFFQM